MKLIALLSTILFMQVANGYFYYTHHVNIKAPFYSKNSLQSLEEEGLNGKIKSFSEIAYKGKIQSGKMIAGEISCGGWSCSEAFFSRDGIIIKRKMLSASPQTADFSYKADNKKNIIQFDSNSYTNRYEYDANNNIVAEMRYYKDDKKLILNSVRYYEYDNKNLLTQQKEGYTSLDKVKPKDLYYCPSTMKYNKKGNIITLFGSRKLLCDNKSALYYYYDDDDNIIEIKSYLYYWDKKRKEEELNIRYEYDNNGYLISRDTNNEKTGFQEQVRFENDDKGNPTTIYMQKASNGDIRSLVIKRKYEYYD